MIPSGSSKGFFETIGVIMCSLAVFFAGGLGVVGLAVVGVSFVGVDGGFLDLPRFLPAFFWYSSSFDVDAVEVGFLTESFSMVL